MQRLIGDYSATQKKQREEDQKDDPSDSAPKRLLLEQQSTYEHANRHKGERADERIACGGLG
jgi:hypothetical protein